MTVASRRPPEALASQARAIGPTVVTKPLQNAVEADTIILGDPARGGIWGQLIFQDLFKKEQ